MANDLTVHFGADTTKLTAGLSQAKPAPAGYGCARPKDGLVELMAQFSFPVRLQTMIARLTIALLALVAAVPIASAQNMVTLPVAPATILTPPLKVYNGHIYQQIGRQFVPIVSGAGDTMTGTLQSTVSGGGLGAAFLAASSAPYMAFYSSNGGQDGKLWNFGGSGTSLNLCAVNDTSSGSTCGLTIIRGGTISVGGPVGWPSGQVIPNSSVSLITMPMLQVTGTSPSPSTSAAQRSTTVSRRPSSAPTITRRRRRAISA